MSVPPNVAGDTGSLEYTGTEAVGRTPEFPYTGNKVQNSSKFTGLNFMGEK
jgi:hypothetical protein